MKTFSIQTLGCRVNHYESQQLTELLRSRGLVPSDSGTADLQVIHTCSVTTAAASQSRQSVRRAVRLSQLPTSDSYPSWQPAREQISRLSRVVVTGCWATSDYDKAKAMPGVNAVLGHDQDIFSKLDQLITAWQREDRQPLASSNPPPSDSQPLHLEGKRDQHAEKLPEPLLDENDDGWITQAGTPAVQLSAPIKPIFAPQVNQIFVEDSPGNRVPKRPAGMTSLPLLSDHQTDRQRALLKVQDGCDAHCSYCIIPQLRPRLWSKPIEAALAEARALVQAGHREIVLTGIFLGAYGQDTALRRRQERPSARALGNLIESLCTQIIGLQRLRLSSLEPGDLTDELLSVLRSHRAVAPHFHLPLQSGSDKILRRMNRQYMRDDYLRMIDQVRRAFDRPALTTDVVVGFPGEDDAEFERTIEVAQASGFMHVHAFPYSPRPGTAAARWTKQYIRGPVVNERMERLRRLSNEQNFAYRESFLGQPVEIIVENDRFDRRGTQTKWRHGRCERYFDVRCEDVSLKPGDSAQLRIVQVTAEETIGQRL